MLTSSNTSVERLYLLQMRECMLSEDFYSHVVFSHGEDISEGISSHFHEQFELRFLFALNDDGSVNYGRLCELRFSPPKVIHPEMPRQDEPAHVTIRIDANSLYYLRGTDCIRDYQLTSGNWEKFGLHLTSFLAVFEAFCEGILTDPRHLAINTAGLISALSMIVDDEKDTSEKLLSRSIARYIQQHYYRADLSIGQIATVLKVSPNYIQRVFRKSHDCTPIRYLIEVRLNAAKYLLQTHRYRVNEVAFLCGWNYPHHFCNCYKQHFGYPPSKEY